MYGLSAGSILLYLLLLCYYDGGFFASFTLGPSMGPCLSGTVRAGLHTSSSPTLVDTRYTFQMLMCGL